jgi:hypothetical protein
MKNFVVTERQRDTILAALRFYQVRVACNEVPRAIMDIAENDHNKPLNDDEIDMLCMAINV